MLFLIKSKPNATLQKEQGKDWKILPLLRTPARARTADKLIKSQLLYQLSYGGVRFCGAFGRGLTDWYPRAGSNRGQID